MKTRNFINIRVLSVLVLIVLSLSSCLKDPRFIDFADSPPLIEFPYAAYNGNKTTLVNIYTTTTTTATPGNSIHTLNINSAGKYVLTVAVNQASANVLSNPVTVTVAVDNSVFFVSTGTPPVLTPTTTTTATTSLVTPASTSAYLSTYYPLPAAAYTVSTLQPVIPANQRLAYFTVTIDPSLIGGNSLFVGVPASTGTVKNYALRFKITDGGGQQISNYNVITYLVQASL